MNNKKVLLINCSYPSRQWIKSASPPIGLGYIAEQLDIAQIGYYIVDLELGYDIRQLQKIIKIYEPDLIGISMMTFRYTQHYKLIETIKKEFPDIKIVVGGPHITSWKSKVLEQCASIDFGIIGEGEKSFIELIKGQMPEKISGLIWRDKSNNAVCIENKWIENLDSLEFPKYRKFELNKYYKQIQICSSRGCPYNCIFCQSNNLGKKWRFRSAENMISEMEYWYNLGYREFIIIDDNFTINKNRVYRFCSAIIEKGFKEIRIKASGIKADLVDYEMLKKMKEAGFYALGFGVESASNKILKIIKKSEDIESIDKTVKAAVDLGYFVVLYFIVGSPYETLEDFEQSLAFAKKYPVSTVYFSNLMPIPGTELYNWVIDNGQFIMPPEKYLDLYAEFEQVPLFTGPGMNLNERKTALEMSSKLQKQIQKKGRRYSVLARFNNPGMLVKFIAWIYSTQIGWRIGQFLKKHRLIS